jgi:diguanylate cyclase (GGDEF)-like protein/PAS domain S-box-containing protein
VNIKSKKNLYLRNKEEVLARVSDDSPFRIAVYDLEGYMLYANEAYIEANALEDIESAKFDDIKDCEVEFRDVLHNLKIEKVYTKEKKKGDKWYKSFFYQTKTNRQIVHLCLDETDKNLYLESLKKTALFFEQSNEGVVITDRKGVILATNNSFCKITGYTKEEAIGKSTKMLKSGTHDKHFYKNLWDSLKHQGKWQGEIWNKRKNGEIYPEWLSITKLIDPVTKELDYMAIFTDISSLKKSDEKLRFYANHDHLTGLLNRTQFENILEQSIQSAIRNDGKFALLFIDLDHFKEVNDTSGHSVGDQVLKEASRRLQKVIRKEDVLARIGGDEFNIIINNVKKDSDVLLLANKLNEAIKQPFLIEDKTFYLTLSIGISLFPKHGLNTKDLSKYADSAMYEVKRNGRNGIMLYNKRFTDSLFKKVSLFNKLKRAIKNEDFEVYYQLVVDTRSKKVSGAEALVRWQHEKAGFIPPDEFIPIAEHHNLVGDIDRFVLREACQALPLLMGKFGNDFVLGVNMSSKDFTSKSFIDELITTVKDFQALPENIELEITESSIMTNQDKAVEKMKVLIKEGFNIALDDFGTGYSSLSYLKKFPISKVKIDKSFVLDILRDEDDKQMVEAIINIAKIFDLEVQAEGVETKEHFDILKSYGAHIAQGYFFSKPMPIDQICSKEWSF